MSTLAIILIAAFGGYIFGQYKTRLRKTRNKDRAFGSHRYYWVSENRFNPRNDRRSYSDMEDRDAAHRAESNPEDF